MCVCSGHRIEQCKVVGGSEVEKRNLRQGSGRKSCCLLRLYDSLGIYLFFPIQSHFPDQETEAQRSEAKSTLYSGMKLESGGVGV